MTDQEIHQTFESLWADVGGPDTFPETKPLLAHYTSISTLECIMKDDVMWMGNPLLMNDFQELRFGITEAARAFRLHEGILNICGGSDNQRYQALLKAFEYKLERVSNDDSFDTYVLCFSEHLRTEENCDGLLSMWRGYGANGSGAAIIFDTEKVNELKKSPLILSKVHYGSTQKRLQWIDDKLVQFADILMKSEIPTDKFYIPVHILLERFKLFALFTKHDGFKEEQEWRLVYLKDRDADGKLNDMLDYNIGKNGIEPKLKLKVGPINGVIGDPISLQKLVTQIILGPSISNVLTLMTVKRMLGKVGKAELADKVKMSTTPFRGI
jgi:hypothetical protein